MRSQNEYSYIQKNHTYKILIIGIYIHDVMPCPPTIAKYPEIKKCSRKTKLKYDIRCFLIQGQNLVVLKAHD